MLTPTRLKQLCQEYGLRPSRHYGQNFLIDPKPIDAMVAAARIDKHDTVVEIGPGFGVLTFALAQKARKVIAFEIEKRIKPYWDEKLKGQGNIEIVWGNALRQLDTATLPADYTVVANLPYQITSFAIRTFLEAENQPSRMVFMVQKEVADRMCAKPGDMSLLSVAVQYYAEPRIVMRVPRSNFWPEPAVDSSVVTMKRKQYEPRNKKDEVLFFQLVKAGFSNKRKLLLGNLGSFLGKQHTQTLYAVLRNIGLNATARAQELSLEEWRRLAKALQRLPGLGAAAKKSLSQSE